MQDLRLYAALVNADNEHTRETISNYGPGAELIKKPDRCRMDSNGEPVRIHLAYAMVIPMHECWFKLNGKIHFLPDGNRSGGTTKYFRTRAEAEEVADHITETTGIRTKVDAYNMQAGCIPCWGISRDNDKRDCQLQIAELWSDELERCSRIGDQYWEGGDA